MTRILIKAAALVALAGGLAACGGGGGGGGDAVVVTPPPPPAATAFEDQFGLGFGATYRLAANTDPRDPSPGDLIAVSFTTDPVPVP
jgi:ABC-type glycerol-3-phosphate transport system substrate-binding protein